MVKVTTSYIAVCKTPSIAININELRETKGKELGTRWSSTSTSSCDSYSDTESESSDFYTSSSSSHFSDEYTRYFSDTDEETNERFEQDLLKLKKKKLFKNVNNNTTKEHQNKINSKSIIDNLRSRSSIDLLRSPKLSRKNISHSTRDISKSTITLMTTASIPEKKQKSYTVEDASFKTGKDGIEMTESGLKPSKSCPSYLFSPTIKRKQIDITTSPAYKEIYAHNLRLYSAVLAKQIAGTGQVGREMDEIRRNKIKQKALNISRKSPKFKRSKSCSPTDMRRSTTDDIPKVSLTGPEQLTEELSIGKENKLDEIGLTQRMVELPKRRSKSLLETQSELASDALIPLKDCQQRHKDAILRAEHCRKKLESFDITIQQADLFLEKYKKQH